jgi:hypothetical protein
LSPYVNFGIFTAGRREMEKPELGRIACDTASSGTRGPSYGHQSPKGSNQETAMEDFDDPLDLLNDDGDGVVEMSLLEEEEEGKQGGKTSNSGCCVVFLALGSLMITGWWVSRFI